MCAATVVLKVSKNIVSPEMTELMPLTGHQAFVCTAPRKFDLNKIADRLPEDAWNMMKAAGTDTEAFRLVSPL